MNDCYCKLDDGTIMRYDLAVTPGKESGIKLGYYNYLGQGVVHSINGRQIAGNERLDFYVIKAVTIDPVG